MGNTVEGPGGQLWRIQPPYGTRNCLYSTRPHEVPPSYEFIEIDTNIYSGLRVIDTNSTWNGTTFQCIAYTPINEEVRNYSSEPVTLEVGGECRI